MKIPKKPGRRELLASLGALSLLPSRINAASLRYASEEQETVRYRVRLAGDSDEESSLDSPLTLTVADVIEPCLAAPKPGIDPLDLVRDALQRQFRADFSEGELPPEYVLVWIDGRWVPVCLDLIVLRVGFGRDGTVEVVAAVDELLG